MQYYDQMRSLSKQKLLGKSIAGKFVVSCQVRAIDVVSYRVHKKDAGLTMIDILSKKQCPILGRIGFILTLYSPNGHPKGKIPILNPKTQKP